MWVFFAAACVPALAEEEQPPVLVLDVVGTINPAQARYVTRGLERARELRSPAVVIRLDTPGGLDGSMRKLAQEILDSPVPVVAYVSPSGAGGALIAKSAHVAATAPEAKDLEDLLSQAEGRQVKTIFGLTTLSFQGKPRQVFPLSLMENILHHLAHPNLAYALLLLGIYGLIYELAVPGALFPGILGAILLVPALVALETLEVNWGGVALIGLSFLFFVATLKRPANRVLAVAGLLSFLLGSAFLFPGIRIVPFKLPWSTIGAAALLTTAFFLGIVKK